MRRTSRNKLLLSLLALTIGGTLYYRQDDFLQVMFELLGISSTLHPGYNNGIQTRGCVIPSLDPWDKNILQYVSQMSPMKCEGDSLFYTDNRYLRFNTTTLKQKYGSQSPRCSYREIVRPDDQSDDRYAFVDEHIFFDNDIKIESEFIHILCYSDGDQIILSDFKAFIQVKPEVEHRCQVAQKDAVLRGQLALTEKPPNVLLLGIDSVSLLNFMRQLPATRQLMHSLGGVELKGYHKVHDNTLVNMLPMLCGQFKEELNFKREEAFDRYSFIWKNFSAVGYRTLFAEDDTSISTFNYWKEGFHKPPADYYMRPFLMAREAESPDPCHQGKLEIATILDWLHDFMDTFSDNPYFAYVFFTALSHDDLNTVGMLDNLLHDFIQKTYLKGFLRNTFLLLYSDHGLRFGSFRKTHAGYLEERLPFMYLLTPGWFRNKYPALQKNLKANAHKLTTPFDIYATLSNILYIKNTAMEPAIQRGLSLFQTISDKRTCTDASIGINWCTCYSQESLNMQDLHVIEAAHAVVEYMNKAIDDGGHRSLCAVIFLGEIRSARVIQNDHVIHRQKDIWSKYPDTLSRNTYQKTNEEALVIQFEDLPCGTVYETTVIHQVGLQTYEVWNHISVISRVGRATGCVTHSMDAQYCCCMAALPASQSPSSSTMSNTLGHDG